MKLTLETNLDAIDATIKKATALDLGEDAATEKKLQELGIDPVELAKRLKALQQARDEILKQEFEVLRATHDLDRTVAGAAGWPDHPHDNPLFSLQTLLGKKDAAAAATGSSSLSAPLSYKTSSSSVPGGSSLSWSFPPGALPGTGPNPSAAK